MLRNMRLSCASITVEYVALTCYMLACVPGLLACVHGIVEFLDFENSDEEIMETWKYDHTLSCQLVLEHVDALHRFRTWEVVYGLLTTVQVFFGVVAFFAAQHWKVFTPRYLLFGVYIGAASAILFMFASDLLWVFYGKNTFSNSVVRSVGDEYHLQVFEFMCVLSACVKAASVLVYKWVMKGRVV